MTVDYFNALTQLSKVNQYNKWMYSCYKKHIGKNVLEIGCGTGNMTALYFNRAENVYATDLSDELIRFVKNRFNAPPPSKN